MKGVAAPTGMPPGVEPGRTGIQRVLDTLYTEWPSFHGETKADANWAMQRDPLEWLCGRLRPGMKSLETGCGYSTAVLAAAGMDHTIVAPFRREVERIKDWCSRHDTDTSRLQYREGLSQDILPQLLDGGFDAVLIDGDHAYPAPAIDFYYTAELLKPGGYLLVDDTQLTTGWDLRAFLLAERARWRVVYDDWKTSIFRKVTNGPAVRGISWVDQPYVRSHNLRMNIRRRTTRWNRWTLAEHDS